MSTDIPTCPRCGQESERVEVKDGFYVKGWMARCLAGPCELQSPIFGLWQTALAWWTKPFARPARDAALREALEHFFRYSTCPCGARHDQPNSHPHVGGCIIEAALNQTEDKTDELSRPD